MPKIISKEEHPVRDGFVVRLDNGKRFSVIDLASRHKDVPSSKPKSQEWIDIFCNLGRYEALRLDPWDSDEMYRGDTMEELLKTLEAEC